MKHEIRVIGILLLMFIATQLIGLVVIDAYTPSKTISVDGINKTIGLNVTVPYGMEPPEIEPQISLISIAISLAIAVAIFFLLMKFKARSLIKIWFTFVVFLTISIALTAILNKIFPGTFVRMDTIALILAIPLTFYKIFKRNVIVHNISELLIYPGLAAIFVPILSIWTTLILLLAISVYDVWAVWRSKLMVNLAKFQIKQLKVFTGFFVPYLPKQEMLKLKKAQKIKNVKSKTAQLKKIKVALAILGGGDVAFPLIFAGVVYRSMGLLSSLIIIAGSTLALLVLFLFSRKGKFYPAMPFLTVGCLLAWLLTFFL